jgi:nucleotide-binding universal stress UspA family protein
MSARYVVAYDGSPAGRRAVDHALAAAKSSGATVLVAHVLEWSPYSFLTPEELADRHKRRNEELARAREAVIEPLVQELAARGTQIETVIRYGGVADTLIEIAQAEDAAEIVAGRSGEQGIAGRLFGTVASKLAQISPVPVTIVP